MVLILGRRRRLCTAVEVPVAERTPILRAYLRKWKFETGMFFDGVTPDCRPTRSGPRWRSATRSSNPLTGAAVPVPARHHGDVGDRSEEPAHVDARDEATLGHRNLVAFNRGLTHYPTRRRARRRWWRRPLCRGFMDPGGRQQCLPDR